MSGQAPQVGDRVSNEAVTKDGGMAIAVVGNPGEYLGNGGYA